jgi:hypothetical protein
MWSVGGWWAGQQRSLNLYYKYNMPVRLCQPNLDGGLLGRALDRLAVWYALAACHPDTNRFFIRSRWK